MDATTPPSEEAVETIRKVYVKDLREKQSIHTVFKVTKKAKQTGRSGRAYIVLTLGDRTGEVDGRIFENVDVLDPTFLEGDFVLVKGSVIGWQKKPQVVVEALERLDPEPIDPAEFAVPPKPAEPSPAPAPTAGAPHAATVAAERPERAEGGKEKVVSLIREQVERVQDPHVRALLLAFLDDPEIAPALPIAPAAKGIHHAYRGGLADHILSVMRLAHRMADHYPMVDRDLLVAGALLHDILKVKEIVPGRGGGFEYSDEGRLVGHLVMTAQKIREKAARISGFPESLEHHITHLVLAHHGQLEWGSPKVPMTLEALLVHQIDTIDSRVQSWLEIMERDGNDGAWTETARLYDRHLWKGVVPTSRKKSPLEGRAGGGRRRGKNKGSQAQGGAGGPQGAHRERERERDRDREKPGREPKGGGLPSFKPLSALESTGPSEEHGGAAPADGASPPAAVPSAE